jgi:hypothetical protein
VHAWMLAGVRLLDFAFVCRVPWGSQVPLGLGHSINMFEYSVLYIWHVVCAVLGCGGTITTCMHCLTSRRQFL